MADGKAVEEGALGFPWFLVRDPSRFSSPHNTAAELAAPSSHGPDGLQCVLWPWAKAAASITCTRVSASWVHRPSQDRGWAAVAKPKEMSRL